MAALSADDAARSQTRRAALQRHERQTSWAGGALLALLAVAATLLMSWGHRRVALPLRALAAQVESGTRLDPAAGHSPIREVASLRAALLRLDQRVAEREAVLRTEREDAELLGRFAEIVQQTTSESELYRLLVRFLDSAVSPAGTTLFSLNPSENHLAMVHPTRSSDDQFRLPIVSEPARCRAIRSARNVLVAQGDDPGTCECALACASSYCCLPLMATGQVIGLVSLRPPRPSSGPPARSTWPSRWSPPPPPPSTQSGCWPAPATTPSGTASPRPTTAASSPRCCPSWSTRAPAARRRSRP